MMIVGLMLCGYVVGAIFMGLQLRRAPCIECEEAAVAVISGNTRRSDAACHCRRCAARHSRRVSRISNHRLRLRSVRHAGKHRETVIRLTLPSR